MFASITDYAQSTADATESSDDSWQTYYDGVTVSADSFISQLQAQVDAQTNWETNMLAIAERVKIGMTGEMADAANGMIDELLKLGPEGAEQVALLASMTDEQFATVVTLWGQKGTDAVSEFIAQAEALRAPVIVVDANMDWAYSKVASFINTVSGMRIGVNAAGQQVSVQMPNGRMAFADGGAIVGPGTGTSDSVPIWGSNGEYMIKADTVAQQPQSYWDNLNAGRFASGGYVGGASSAVPAPATPAMSFDYRRLAREIANVQIVLNGQVVSQSVDQWIGGRVR